MTLVFSICTQDAERVSNPMGCHRHVPPLPGQRHHGARLVLSWQGRETGMMLWSVWIYSWATLQPGLKLRTSTISSHGARCVLHERLDNAPQQVMLGQGACCLCSQLLGAE